MKKIINIMMALTFITGLSSCLKDDTIIGPDSPGAIKNVVEFQNISAPTSAPTAPFAVYIPFTLKPTATTADFEAIINYAGADVAPQDIVVNLASDATILTKYNAGVSGAAYFAPPTGSYSFPATVTIPAGQRQVKVKISLKPNAFDATKENALPIRITSSSFGNVSGNFGAVIFSLPLESIWQGTYTVSYNNNYGTIDANLQPAFTETGVKLATVGPNRLRSELVCQTYSGYQTWQFNGNNTSITAVTTFSGSERATSIQSIDLIDATARKFSLHYTWLGRGMVEEWTRTGD